MVVKHPGGSADWSWCEDVEKFRSDSGSQSHAVYCSASLCHSYFSSTSHHQWVISKASLLLKFPAEGFTRDNRGDPVRKWLFKSVHQLTCLPNEESCCYWWQLNYFVVTSRRDIYRHKLIDPKHLIYTSELKLTTCRSLTRQNKRTKIVLLDKLPLTFSTPNGV